MIPPAECWAIQVELTTLCPRRCSNCTRLTALRSPKCMDMETFRESVHNLREFPTDSPPSVHVPRMTKCVGVIGGEPLEHPLFELVTHVMSEEIPHRKNRGLWTGVPTPLHLEGLIDAVYGYVNRNHHRPPCQHQPILVASQELIPDEAERKKWTDKCWCNAMWSPIVTSRGVYFCEVAGTLDDLFELGVALPNEDGWWRKPLDYFQNQIDACCRRCGVAMPLPTRRDADNVDDISPGNLAALDDMGKGETRTFEVYDTKGYDPNSHLCGWEPRRYLR